MSALSYSLDGRLHKTVKIVIFKILLIDQRSRWKEIDKNSDICWLLFSLGCKDFFTIHHEQLFDWSIASLLGVTFVICW